MAVSLQEEGRDNTSDEINACLLVSIEESSDSVGEIHACLLVSIEEGSDSVGDEANAWLLVSTAVG